MQKQIRYRDILDQIAGGNVWSVYVDDTGPAGNSTSSFLPADRQSHVAAIFPSQLGRILMEQMPGVLQELNVTTGSSEFHFVDIYNGKGRYRELPLDLRIGLFEFFAKLVEDHEISFIVQSLDSVHSQHIMDAFHEGFEPLKKAFNTNDMKDLSLLLLLVQIRRHLIAHMPKGLRAAVFIDEGWKKNGVGVGIPTFDDHFLHGTVFSARSVDIPGLQFADFGAFLLNRSQLLVGKSSLSELDERILALWQRVGSYFVNPAWPSVTRMELEVHGCEGGGIRLLPKEPSK